MELPEQVGRAPARGDERRHPIEVRVQVRVAQKEQPPPLPGSHETEERARAVGRPRGLDPRGMNAADAALAIQDGTRIEIEPDPLSARARERVIVDREHDARPRVSRDAEDPGAQARKMVDVDDAGSERQESVAERALGRLEAGALEEARAAAARVAEAEHLDGVAPEGSVVAKAREDGDVMALRLRCRQRKHVRLRSSDRLRRKPVHHVQDPQPARAGHPG
jgi:hypothetical protein